MIGLVLATLLAFQGTGGRAPLPGGTVAPGATDTAALTRRAVEAERVFLSQWYNAWRASELMRWGPAKVGKLAFVDARQPDLSCNPDANMYVPDHAWGTDRRTRRVASANGVLGVCPNWIEPAMAARQATADERLGIDGALVPKMRAPVAENRAQLIALFDSSVAAMPSNGALTGQLVRFLVDQGNVSGAVKAAGQCKTDAWWCGALRGYALARAGDNRAAGSAFAASAAALLEADRCTWTDVNALLDSAARAAYTAMSCAARQEFNTRFWWLTDPLWSDPGNDRYVEQFARKVTVLLHSATQHDERYTWLPEYGGDALEQVIARYGWPTYAYWGIGVKPGLPPTADMDSVQNDKANVFEPHGEQIIGNGITARGLTDDKFFQRTSLYERVTEVAASCIPDPPGKPICTGSIDQGPLFLPEKANAVPRIGSVSARSIGSTLEYSTGRMHAVPAWRALGDPFGARNEDWALNAPPRTEEALTWWPREHYAPAHAIVQFSDQQTALLRRDQHTLLAFSTNLAQADLARHAADSVEAQLLVSSDPSRIERIAADRFAMIDRAVFLEPLPDRPVVVSVEIPWDSAGQPAGRSRFGVRPPAPLSRMKRGEVAISEPVLLLAPAGGLTLPNDAELAIPSMLGSTTLSAGTTAVGVYWETYGFGARDTVDVTLRVQRSDNSSTPVTVGWQEPRPDHDTRTVAGAVPIQMRSVVVEVSALRPGAYVLKVAVARPGGTAVQSERSFVIR